MERITIIIPTSISEDEEKVEWFVCGYLRLGHPIPLPYWVISADEFSKQWLSKELQSLVNIYKWGTAQHNEEDHPRLPQPDGHELLEPHVYDTVDYMAGLSNKLGIPFKGYGYGKNT